MYAKVFAQIYDGTLCTHGPWEALVTFQQLLILADKDGNVDMTIPAISRRTTIPLEILEKGIKALLEPDPHSRTPTEEGRRIIPLAPGRDWGWSVVNYTHYRSIKREEDRRDYHREYWHKRKLKDSTQTQQPQPNQPIAEAKAEAEAKKQKRAPKQSFDAGSMALPPFIGKQTWGDWIEYRRGRKLSLNEQTMRQQLANLIIWNGKGYDANEIILTSIANGWQGLFEPKRPPDNRPVAPVRKEYILGPDDLT